MKSLRARPAPPHFPGPPTAFRRSLRRCTACEIRSRLEVCNSSVDCSTDAAFELLKVPHFSWLRRLLRNPPPLFLVFLVLWKLHFFQRCVRVHAQLFRHQFVNLRHKSERDRDFVTRLSVHGGNVSSVGFHFAKRSNAAGWLGLISRALFNTSPCSLFWKACAFIILFCCTE